MTAFSFRRLTFGDVPALRYIWHDSEVIRYTGILMPCTDNEIKIRIERFEKEEVFAVLEQNRLIGVIGCPVIDVNKKHYGVFYQFRKSVWGRGIAGSCTQRLVSYMRLTHPYARLYADVLTANVASERILINLGFQFVSEEAYVKGGCGFTLRQYELVLNPLQL